MVTNSSCLSQISLTTSEENYILLIDDNLEFLNALEIQLNKLSSRIIKATNSSQAIKLASEIIPDVIVLDLCLAEVSGYDVLAQIRSLPLLLFVPVLIVSGQSASTELTRSIENGADDYIEKPFSYSLLKLKILNLLRLNRLRACITYFERMRNIANTLTYGLIEIDQSFNILWMNHISSGVFGMSNNKWSGMNLKEYFHTQSIPIQDNLSLNYLFCEINTYTIRIYLSVNQTQNAGTYSLEKISTINGYGNKTYLLRVLYVDSKEYKHM